jgi:hypothetical protein
MLEPHDFAIEKADALQRLADLVTMIVNPPDKSNVVELPMREGAKAHV